MTKKVSKKLGLMGFTLVELMATVAIIGVLAAVAIPNYTKYQRKARQAEAKVVLGAGYIGENTLKNAENGGAYSACIGALGGGSEGVSFYTVGFGTSVTTLTTCQPFGKDGLAGGGVAKNSCLAFSWRRSAGVTPTYTIAAGCANAENSTWFKAKDSRPDGTGIPDQAALELGLKTMSNTVFELMAAGAIGGTSLDGWAINHDKQIYQIQDGVSGN